MGSEERTDPGDGKEHPARQRDEQPALELLGSALGTLLQDPAILLRSAGDAQL